MGLVRKKTGHKVHGLRIEYELTRKVYRGKGARRGESKYLVAPGTVAATAQRFVQVVEVPTDARNVHFYSDQAGLPPKYELALQKIRQEWHATALCLAIGIPAQIYSQTPTPSSWREAGNDPCRCC